MAASSRIRALGTGHSFSPVADTAGDQVSVAGLPVRFEVAPDRSSATVSAGLRYGEVATRAAGRGAGSARTSGRCRTSRSAARWRPARTGPARRSAPWRPRSSGSSWSPRPGSCCDWTAATRRFAGAVVALGSLGVVTAITLAVEPTYDVTQRVYDDMPVARLDTDLDEVLAAGDSVSVFTTWRPDVVDQVWVKRRTDRDRADLPDSWLGATAADDCPAPGGRPARRGVHRRSSVSPVRGTRGCRTSGWTTPPATGTSCRRSTSSRASTRFRCCAPSAHCASG